MNLEEYKTRMIELNKKFNQIEFEKETLEKEFVTQIAKHKVGTYIRNTLYEYIIDSITYDIDNAEILYCLRIVTIPNWYGDFTEIELDNLINRG